MFSRLLMLAGVVIIAGCHGCHKKDFWPFAQSSENAKKAPPSGPTGTLVVGRGAPGPHPRVLLTADRLKAITARKAANAPSWTYLLEQCDHAIEETIESGYEGFDWANSALSLAICWKTTSDDKYAAAGVKYLTALLDDKYKVGDHDGGEHVVEHDDGYPIRSRGWLGAMAYDWLYDAPDMTSDLKKKMIDRLVAWTNWFGEKGYNHDEPIANYYAGYFGAVAIGGIACEGDDPRAAELRKRTETMWNRELVPTFASKLAGGDFPEGWQYGDLVGALLAIYAEAEITSHPVPEGTPPPKPLTDDMPWLKDTVAYHAHSVFPDGKHVYDTGDWSDKPAVLQPHTLYALSMIFPKDDATAKRAHFLGDAVRDDATEEWKWLGILADDPARPKEDPRTGQASYLATGTATMMSRSAWKPSAIWVGMSSAPSLSDHQHLDAGHFEIVRGDDPLFIDGGGYGSYSSLSHNVIIVDDPAQDPDPEKTKKSDLIRYKENQGTWSDSASIARFEDANGIVYAMADYASAWNRPGWPDDKKRAVERAERELVFSRAKVTGASGDSARVVIYDRMTLSQPSFTTTFVLHGGPAPETNGSLARFTSGASSAWVTTLLPENAKAALSDETHNQEADRAYYTNKPPEGVTSVRYEIASPMTPASTERRFLHAIVIGSSDLGDARPTPERVRGEGIDGVALDGEVYAFMSDAPQATPTHVSYSAPSTSSRHVVVGLTKGGSYEVRVANAADGACKVDIGVGVGRAASLQGVLVLDVEACSLK